MLVVIALSIMGTAPHGYSPDEVRALSQFGPPPRSSVQQAERRVISSGFFARRGCEATLRQWNRFYWFRQSYSGPTYTIDYSMIQFVFEKLSGRRRGSIYLLHTPRIEPTDDGNRLGVRDTIGGQWNRRTSAITLDGVCARSL